MSVKVSGSAPVGGGRATSAEAKSKSKKVLRSGRVFTPEVACMDCPMVADVWKLLSLGLGGCSFQAPELPADIDGIGTKWFDLGVSSSVEP